MPIRYTRKSIIHVPADAIVCTTRNDIFLDYFMNYAVYRCTGSRDLRNARRALGVIESGCAATTSAFAMSSTKSIIHIAVPDKSVLDKRAVLRQCYTNCLSVAKDLNCETIAIPVITVREISGEEALRIAEDACETYLNDNDLSIILIVKKISLQYDGLEEYLSQFNRTNTDNDHFLGRIIKVIRPEKEMIGVRGKIGKNASKTLKNTISNIKMLGSKVTPSFSHNC